MRGGGGILSLQRSGIRCVDHLCEFAGWQLRDSEYNRRLFSKYCGALEHCTEYRRYR